MRKRIATDILNSGLMLEKHVRTTVNICFKVHDSVEFKMLDGVFVKRATRDLERRTRKDLLLHNFHRLTLGI